MIVFQPVDLTKTERGGTKKNACETQDIHISLYFSATRWNFSTWSATEWAAARFLDNSVRSVLVTYHYDLRWTMSYLDKV